MVLEDLRRRWEALRAANPAVRARDAARSLGVSEAELVACRTGDGVVELEADWGRLIEWLPSLGEVMALTRNEHAVHEKVGRFDHVEIGAAHALVVNREIDLRLSLAHWRFGFAVEEQVRPGIRFSLQFFDGDGTAVHKVYLRGGSDSNAYDALVERFKRREEPRALPILPPARRPAEHFDDEIDVVGLRAHWAALRDTHDFSGLLRAFGVSRLQALRLAGEDFAYPVERNAVELCLTECAARQISIMCFVGNHGCMQIHTGKVANLKTIDSWFNVLDAGFNLHLDTNGIDTAWVVRKPTRDGVVTSLELYDRRGECIVRFFGERKAGRPENGDLRSAVESLPTQPSRSDCGVATLHGNAVHVR